VVTNGLEGCNLAEAATPGAGTGFGNCCKDVGCFTTTSTFGCCNGCEVVGCSAGTFKVEVDFGCLVPASVLDGVGIDFDNFDKDCGFVSCSAGTFKAGVHFGSFGNGAGCLAQTSVLDTGSRSSGEHLVIFEPTLTSTRSVVKPTTTPVSNEKWPPLWRIWTSAYKETLKRE